MANSSYQSELSGRLLSPHELAEMAPSIRKGRKATAATVKRWMRSGLRGERLPYVLAGSQPCSTEDALMQFFRRLAAADENRRFVSSDDLTGLTAGAHSAKRDDQRLAYDDERARSLGI